MGCSGPSTAAEKKSSGAIHSVDPTTHVASAGVATLSDAEILEVIAAVALNIFTNYLNLAADTDIDFPLAAELAHAA